MDSKKKIITNVMTTFADILDSESILQIVNRTSEQLGDLGLKIRFVSADRGYCSGENLRGLETLGIVPYIPSQKYANTRGGFSKDQFTYNKEKDEYTCPNNKVLRYRSRVRKQADRYVCKAKDCRECKLKSLCLPGKRGRSIRHSDFYEEYESLARRMSSSEGKKAMRLRKTGPEPLFGEAKLYHGLRKFMTRGIDKAKKNSIIIATVQNLKRLINGMNKNKKKIFIPNTIFSKTFTQFYFWERSLSCFLSQIKSGGTYATDSRKPVLQRYAFYFKVFILFPTIIGEVVKDLLLNTSERAINYLNNIQTRKVIPDKDAVNNLKQFDIPLPEKPCSPESVLQTLDDLGSPATMAMAGPRFYGFVIGGSVPASLAAHWLASTWDQNTAFSNITPAAATLEQIALKWMLDILHLPPQSAGAFVTGTTVANFTSIIAARHKLLSDLGWNVEAKGLYGAPEINVYLGEEAHTTLFKSLSMSGLGGNRVTIIPVDNQGRINFSLMPEIKPPAILCVQAGNVNTGAIDPIDELCSYAHDKGAWVHVDGAFGLWAGASPLKEHLVKGIEKADSWATDAHKWLNVPYDSGVAFVKDADSLKAAMSITADYLPTQTNLRNPSDYTPELSRRARGVDIWAAMLSLGREGLRELVERNCRHAKRFAEVLSKNGYQILNAVQLNQVLVSFGTPEETLKVVSGIQEDGTCWCGSTVWQGKTAMRISISGWNTTEDDVEKSLEAMLRAAKSYSK